MAVNQELASKKLLSAVAELQTGMESDAVLRPSSVGQCPARAWVKHRGLVEMTERDLKYSWHAFQGDLFENAVRQLLRLAGAQVLDPVEPLERFGLGLSQEEADPLTGMIPHGDGAILWPEVGITEWSILELKHLRAMAARAMILEGVQESERTYWFQSVAYLKLAWLICKNNAWDIPVPQQSFILLGPKDPSTVAMFLRQALASPKYESEEPKKGYSEAQKEMMAKRVKYRARLEGLYEPDTFYWERLGLDELRVQHTWDVITLQPQLMRADAPTFLHDPLAESLDSECEWYCEAREWCVDYHVREGVESAIETGLRGVS